MVNSYILIVLAIFAGVIISASGLLVSRRFAVSQQLKDFHDVGASMLSVVGTMYAVLLGLVVVDAMQQYQAARDVTQKETNNLVDVYLLAQRLPEPTRGTVRQICGNYADRVINVEWGEMKDHSFCPVARGMAIELMQTVMDFEPKTETEKLLYPQLVQEASRFWQDRQERVQRADRKTPPIETVVLAAGAALTVACTYLFRVDNVRLHVLMTSIVALVVLLNITLWTFFANPFSGDTAVQADSFKTLKQVFTELPQAK